MRVTKLKVVFDVSSCTSAASGVAVLTVLPFFCVVKRGGCTIMSV